MPLDLRALWVCHWGVQSVRREDRVWTGVVPLTAVQPFVTHSSLVYDDLTL